MTEQTGAETVTVEQAARALGIGRALAYELARNGGLPALRLGRRLVVPTIALKALLASGTGRTVRRSR